MIHYLTILLASFFLISCSKDKKIENEVPTEKGTFLQTTNETSDIIVYTALLTGSLKIEGSVNVQEVGFCWNVDPMPTTIHQKYSIESLKGVHQNIILSLNTTIEGLFERTQYFVRAYAIIDGVIHYGQEQTFHTLTLEGLEQFWSVEDLFKYQNLSYFYDTSTKVLFVFDMNETGNTFLLKFLNNIESDRMYNLVDYTKVLSDTQTLCGALIDGEDWSIPENKKFTLSTSTVENKMILTFNDIELVNDKNVVKKSSGLIVLE